MREQSTLHEVLNAMHDIMLAERASFAVPANGRGGFMFTKDSPNPFDPNDNGGLMRTDKLGLVFEDVILKENSTNGEPPYCDPDRLDLCPNIRRVKLSDFRSQVSASAHTSGPRQTTPKVGRNDPCPCGSGKKCKKCCGGVVN